MLLGAGKPIEFVAAELKRSEKAVTARAQHAPNIAQTCKSEAEGEGEMRPLVASPVWTREEDELPLALVFSGTSVAEMAKRLHRSRAAVYHRAGKLKIVLAKSRRWKAKGS